MELYFNTMQIQHYEKQSHLSSYAGKARAKDDNNKTFLWRRRLVFNDTRTQEIKRVRNCLELFVVGNRLMCVRWGYGYVCVNVCVLWMWVNCGPNLCTASCMCVLVLYVNLCLTKKKLTTGIVCALFLCLNVYVFVYVCVFCTYECVLEREYLVLFMCKCTFMYFSDQLFLLI